MAKRSGERVGVKGTFAARPPHPILHVATIELPYPRKRGEGAITTTARVVISHHFKQPISFPRRVFCARGLLCRFTHPDDGVGGAPRVVGCLRGTRGACTIGAGQAPSEAPCVPRRGTLASRRSTVAIFGSGAALLSPEPASTFASAGSARLQRSSSRPGRSARRAAFLRLPRPAVTSRRRGTPLLAPHSGVAREHAPNERGYESLR